MFALPEFISLFLKNTAIGRWFAAAGLKTLMWIVLVTALAGAAYYVYHKFEALQADLATAQQTIHQQDQQLGVDKQQLVDDIQAMKELNKQLVLAQATQTNNDKAEKTLQTIVDANQKKHDDQATKLHSYVKTIEANPTLPDDQKSVLIATSYIEHLWTGHCGLIDGTDPICQKYASSPPAELTPAEAAGQPTPASAPPATAEPNTPAPSSVAPPPGIPVSQADVLQVATVPPLVLLTT